MSAGILRDIVISILLCLFLWAVVWYTELPFTKPDLDLSLSIENEIKLGEMVEESMRSSDPEMAVLDNYYVDSCVNLVAARLIAELDSTRYTYQVTTIKSRQVNAFAIPGGKIFICAGLLSFVDNAEEFSSVLAHEMGHVEQRHVVNKMIKQLGITGLIMIISNGEAGVVEELGSEILSTYFDREQETEADTFALSLLERSGISPSHMPAVFQKMHTHLGDNSTPEFLSTHPDMDKRALLTAAYVTSSSFTETPFDIDWQRLKSELKIEPE